MYIDECKNSSKIDLVTHTRKLKGHVGINNQGAILDYCVVTLETCDKRDPLDMQDNVI